MVYYQHDNYSAALPFTLYDGNTAISFLFAFIVGILEIDILSNVDINTPSVNYEYKIIIVPSSVISSHPNINWEKYEEVSDSLKI